LSTVDDAKAARFMWAAFPAKSVMKIGLQAVRGGEVKQS
jgi:hypothetical protein